MCKILIYQGHINRAFTVINKIYSKQNISVNFIEIVLDIQKITFQATFK